MNRISYAGRSDAGKAEFNGAERTNKNYEIIIPDARGEISCEGGVYAYDTGCAVVIPPLVRHILRGGGGLSVTIEQALLPFKEIRVIRDDGEGGIAYAARQAVRYFNSDVAKKELVLTALGGLLVSYVTAFADSGQFSPVVAMIRADVSRYLSDSTYSLEDSMRKMPLNYDYVRKLFKKEVGVTPHEYLMRERMELARGLILSGISNQYSSYTVSQIAEACGFAEPLYFSRVFKKYFGVAPSEYGKK